MSSNIDVSEKSLASIAKTLSEMYRPRLFFNILPGRIKPNLLEIVLRNSGGSAAYNINCNFDPDLTYYDNTTLSTLAVFKNIPFLEHGQELRFGYRSLIEILEEGPAFGHKESTVTITYGDSMKTSYTDQYLVNIERFKGLMIPDRRDVKDLYQELVNIRNELQRFRSTGVLIKSSTDIKEEREEWLKKVRESEENSSKKSGK